MEGDFKRALMPEEVLVTYVPIDGIGSSKHLVLVSSQAVITNQRLIGFSKLGAFKKRFAEQVSWPLDAFQPRSNSNEGSALGKFLYCLALFTTDEETILIGFKRQVDRDGFRDAIHAAIGDVLP